MIRLRCAKETADDLALANFSKMACCFSVTVTLAAFPGMAILSEKMSEKSSFRPIVFSSKINSFSRH